MNKQQEPRLRFKGFTGVWEEKCLDEIGEFSAGGDIKKEKLTLFGRYPVLANALTNNGIVGFYDDYEFESPAITITGRGDVGIAKARKENFSAVVRLLVLKNKPNYDVDFLEQAINKIDFHIESTGVPQLTVPQCKWYSIYLSSEPEQTHLGLFFRRLDSQIAESRAMLEKSRQLKKAMLAKMFPANGEKIPKIRFKGFEGEWEEKKLGDVLSIKSGMSQKDIEVSDGIYPILATGGEIGRTNTALYDKESVLIGRKGTIDKPYYMNTPFWTVDTLFYSELKDNVDGKFLYFLFQCIEWRKLDTSTGVPSLTSTTIHEIQRYFPKKEEQAAIGNFFRKLDVTIALQSAEVEKLNQLKKGLLAAMLV